MLDVEDETNPVITPLQDQRICTRQSPCNEKECPICDIPGSEIHHTQDLTEALGNTPSPKVPKPEPPAPPDHIISDLVDDFQLAIFNNNIGILEITLNQLKLASNTCIDFSKFDRPELFSLMNTTKNIIASTTQPPTPTAQQPKQHHQPQTTGLKTPRMETPTWNGDPYSFYAWLSSCSK